MSPCYPKNLVKMSTFFGEVLPVFLFLRFAGVNISKLFFMVFRKDAGEGEDGNSLGQPKKEGFFEKQILGWSFLNLCT